MTAEIGSLVLAALMALGCHSRPPVDHTPAEHERVGHYTSSARTFETNAFFIEGDDGVVLIDTMFTPSQGIAAVEHAEAVTGKPVVLAIVLHANPDKFNGTPALQARGIRVVTSAQVSELIPDVFALRTRWFGERYAPDWPTDTPAPESFGAESTSLNAAGLQLRLHVLGPAVSQAHVVVEWRGHVFVGDLVANGHHGWLELGRSGDWLRRIDEIEALEPRFVHPGRGRSAGPELLVGMRRYLQTVRTVVADAEPCMPVQQEEIARLTAAVQSRYPRFRHPVFLRVGLPAEYRRAAHACTREPNLGR